MEQATAPAPSSARGAHRRRPARLRGPDAACRRYRFVTDPVGFSEAGRRRFGDTFGARIVRSGDVVFVSDPDSIKRLFGADRINTIAPGRNLVLEPLLGKRSVLLLEGKEHLQRRKLMLPPFHGERMRAYEGMIETLARARGRALAARRALSPSTPRCSRSPSR